MATETLDAYTDLIPKSEDPYADLVPEKPSDLEISHREPDSFLREGYRAARELMSPVLGPTREQATREAVSIDGQPVYKPAGSEVSRLGLLPALSKPFVELPRIPQQEGTAAQILAGIGNTGIGFAEFMESPLGLLTAGIGGAARGIASPAARALERTVAGGFAADMAAHLPESYRQTSEAAKRGDVQGTVEGATGTAASALLAGGLGAHALGYPRLKSVPPAVEIRALENLKRQEVIPQPPEDLSKEADEQSTVVPTSRELGGAQTPIDVDKVEQRLADRIIETKNIGSSDFTHEGMRNVLGNAESGASLDPLIQLGIIEKTPDGLLRFNQRIQELSAQSDAERAAYAKPAIPPAIHDEVQRLEAAEEIGVLSPEDAVRLEAFRNPQKQEVPSARTIESSMETVRSETPGSAAQVAAREPGEVLKPAKEGGASQAGADVPKGEGVKIVRYSHKGGKGLLDRSAWDLSKLTEDEELELPELLDFGLEQPRGVPAGHKFYFTEEGEQKHAELIRLISKASKRGIVREESTLGGDPSWKSNDGQLAVDPSKTAKLEAPKETAPPAPESSAQPTVEPPVESAKPVSEPTTPPGDAISWLQSKKIDTQGKLFDALQGIPVAVYNAAIDVAIAGVKAGRAIAEVVREAARFLKEKYPHLDEDAVAKQIMSGIADFKGGKESKSITERIKEASAGDETPPSRSAVVTGMRHVASVWNAVSKLPKFTPFKETLNRWIGSLQMSSIEVKRIVKDFESRVKDPKRREAITNWIQAAGNKEVLLERARTSEKKFRKGYEDAANLTPEELKLAKEITGLFADKLKQLQDEGLLKEGLENYVNQIWKRGFLKTDAQHAAQFAGKLASKFKFANKRTFPSFFEGEQAGFKPLTKDISKLVGIYISEANKVLATRKFIADLTTKKASDGRFLAYPEGAGTIVPADEQGNPGRVLTFSNAKPAEYSDYRNDGISEPALTKWKWLAEDEAGQPVMMKGNLAFHPEIYDHMRKVFGRSAISEWYRGDGTPISRVGKLTAKLIDESNKVAKATMLSGFISPFHAVQEGTHAVGHKINPFFNLPVLDEKNPAQARAMNHGLMLSGDRVAMEHFVEGLHSHNLLRYIPVLGEWSNNFSSWLFERYIPALKFKTYEAIRQRNLARFKNEIAKGEYTVDDVEYLSARQSNNAYGHLNYADIGRDPTIQHLARLGALAPDFLEARTKFSAQAAQGLSLAKIGREQLNAMALLAGTIWVTARILNKTGDDDYHWDHPFSVIYKGKEYQIRSVPGDIVHAIKDSRKFISGRVSPLISGLVLEGMYGLNYRGEKVTKMEALGDALMNVVPLTLRQIPGIRQLVEHFSTTQKNRTVSPWEQAMGAMGLQISRYSPITETYKNAHVWKAQHGIPEDRGTYPVSKYQQLRYALEDGDFEKAKEEIKILRAGGMTQRKIELGFAESIGHPFTGSKATDEQMKKSLPPKERRLYDQAIERRKVILERFKHVK